MKKENKNMKAFQIHITHVELHFEQVRYLMHELKNILPFTEENLKTMAFSQKALCDSLLYRFAMIQDTLGGKILPLIIDMTKEKTVYLTFIDKLHFLERLHIVDDAYEWSDIRDLRNAIAHVYEPTPQEQANSLNKIYKALPVLEECFKRIKKRLAEISDSQ